MHVDIFGRTLKKKHQEGARGPPGNGYKLTSDGHFDAEDRRLCNIADPSEPNDAVNLQTLKNSVEPEFENLNELTKKLKTDVDNLNLLFNTYRLEIDVKIHQKFNELVKNHINLVEFGFGSEK